MTLETGNCRRKAQFELSGNGDVNTMFSAFSAFYLRGDQVSSPEISGTTQLPVFTCYQKADKRPKRKGWRTAWAKVLRTPEGNKKILEDSVAKRSNFDGIRWRKSPLLSQPVFHFLSTSTTTG